MEITTGQTFKGKVTGIKPFGAFVQLENGKSGLVHISELSDKFVSSVDEVVEIGQEVEVRVKEVAENGKLNFSMKKEVPKRPAKPARDLDKMLADMEKDSNEKFAILNRGNKGQKRRG